MIRIFYHDDMDGRCAAHLALTYDKSTAPKKCFPMNYGKPFPLKEIKPIDVVYILDYSIEPDEMRKLLDITEDVIWIDHHKSAIDKYSNTDDVQVAGSRHIDYRAGCGLTWNWFHPSAIRPEYVKLIGDRDSWTWEYGERTAYFFSALESYDTTPESPKWGTLKRRHEVELMIEAGAEIQRYKDRTRQEFIDKNGFYTTWEGHSCYIANGYFGSEPFEVVAPTVDIWIQFWWIKSFWKVSLFSTTVCVREIAQKYGGGGHDKAAGFQTSSLSFLPSQ